MLFAKSIVNTSDGGDPIMSVLHHALDSKVHAFGAELPFTRFQAMVGLTGLVLIIAAIIVDKRSAVPRGFLRNSFESILLFIRDELVRPAFGGHGDGFVPFFATCFFFILTSNLLGILPIPFIGGTATSNLDVTGALAGIVILVSFFGGLFTAKSHFLHLFVPGGLPKALVPLLFVLELVGFFIKHGVLMVRLFANMLAGHLVIGAFIGLIFFSKSYGVAVPVVGLALFVSCLELLVAFLQAYVFTLLAVLFVGGMVHPDH
jgi:F-type H+-transporting ATPase subunit a